MIQKVKDWKSNTDVRQYILHGYNSRVFGENTCYAERLKDGDIFMIGDIIYDRTIKQTCLIRDFDEDCARVYLSVLHTEEFLGWTKMNNIEFKEL